MHDDFYSNRCTRCCARLSDCRCYTPSDPWFPQDSPKAVNSLRLEIASLEFLIKTYGSSLRWSENLAECRAYIAQLFGD